MVPGADAAGMAALFRRRTQGRRRHHLRFRLCLGPRINAAGRLADMTLGIECLLTDDAARADELAACTLDGINRERREIEGDMREQACCSGRILFDEGDEPPPAICVFDPTSTKAWSASWPQPHQGQAAPPHLCVSPPAAAGQGTRAQGSGRSIAGFHLRDALDLVAKRHPGVLLRFGGHAMAAGCTIHEGLDV